jgi:non-specific serine/threonine protein kinase
VETVGYQCGEVLIDPINRRFSRGTHTVNLESKIFAVILELLARPNELISREQLLDAVWGHRHVTPSTLNRAIAIARRAFGGEAGSATFIQTVHGAGYRFVGPVCRQIQPEHELRARFLPPLTARLPARLTTIIGRDEDFKRISVALAASRAVTLVGTGGMGKTQCALEYARRNENDFPDGVWCMDLARTDHGGEWLRALAAMLGISGKCHAELIAGLSEELKSRRLLLLLDNCDRVAAAVGAIAVELLLQTEHLKFLATSQQQFDCVGERVLRLPPLTLPDADVEITAATLSAIIETPAVALLLERIQAIQPNFVLTLQNAVDIVGICRQLDGMPLALELAATRFALLSADQVLTRLQNRFRFLVGEVGGRDSRHQTLTALIEWSFALLSAGEQRLLCWLGVFVRGWSIDIAEDLSASMGVDTGDFVDLLSGLVKKSLVAVDANDGSARYKLLESIRDFALQQLDTRGESDAARSAHLNCVRRMARRAHADMLSTRMSVRIAALKLEHSNIDAALSYAQERHDESAGVEIIGSLLLYIKSHGAIVEGLVWSERVLNPMPAIRSSMCARALLLRGILEMHLMRSASATDSFLSRAWEMAAEVNDRWAMSSAASYRTMHFAERGVPRQTDALQRRAHELAQELRDDWLLGLAGLARGWWHLQRCEFSEAVTTLEAARSRGHDLQQQHFIEMYLGLASYELQQLPAAARSWHNALCNTVLVAHSRGMAGSIEGCAYLCLDFGDAATAFRLLNAAAATRSKTQVPLFSFWLPYHEAAVGRIQAALGELACGQLLEPANMLRMEDATNLALELLQRYSGSTQGASPLVTA